MRAARWAACGLLAVALAGPASAPVSLRAQAPLHPDDLVNVAFDQGYGIGGYDVGDRSTGMVRIPVTITVRSLERYPWGLRLRLAGTFALTEFRDLDALLDDPRSRTVALMPGVEGVFRVGRTSVLRPFLDVGAARLTRTDRTVYLGVVGARGEFIFPRDRWQFGLEPLVQYNLSSGGRGQDDFGSVSLKADARRALWFTMGEAQPDAGVYGEAGYFYDQLEFTLGQGQTLGLRTGFELGVSAGFFYPRPKVWIVRIPRVAVGYRFGGDLDGLRIRVGGDWITPVPR